MSIVGRLEKSVEFMKANAWGRYDDKHPDENAPDGFKYCAQGAIAYGGFADSGMTFCPGRALFHKGKCTIGLYDECTVKPDEVVDLEFRETINLCDDVANKLRGSGWGGLTWYNDDISRTKEDMIVVLEKAIERAKKGQA